VAHSVEDRDVGSGLSGGPAARLLDAEAVDVERLSRTVTERWRRALSAWRCLPERLGGREVTGGSRPRTFLDKSDPLKSATHRTALNTHQHHR
jgi:hypothetical protein